MGCNQLGQYILDEYHDICNLVTHAVQVRNSHDLFRRAIIAILLLSVFSSRVILPVWNLMKACLTFFHMLEDSYYVTCSHFPAML